jgi:hypothetical protein
VFNLLYLYGRDLRQVSLIERKEKLRALIEKTALPDVICGNMLKGAYDKEEIIPLKCNIHPWMQGYFVVLGTSQFAVTGEDGHFSLPNLPPGHYVVSAWHETLGTQSRDFTLSADESQTINFVFKTNP